jgi:hypothetical protein
VLRSYYEDAWFLLAYGPPAVFAPLFAAFALSWGVPFFVTYATMLLIMFPYASLIGVAILCKQVKDIDRRLGACSERLEAWARENANK